MFIAWRFWKNYCNLDFLGYSEKKIESMMNFTEVATPLMILSEQVLSHVSAENVEFLHFYFTLFFIIFLTWQ